MSRALELAQSYCVGVRFADLGDWGDAQLYSEYDPRVPEIVINARVARRLDATRRREFVELAVGHELYHHREAIGEVVSPSERIAREAAADAYARELRNRPAQ